MSSLGGLGPPGGSVGEAVILFSLGVLCLVLYLVLRRQDRRMLRNGVALVCGWILVLVGVMNLLWDDVPALGWLLAKAIVAALLGILLLGVFLMVNGVIVFRREGRSLGNLLSRGRRSWRPWA